MGNTEKVGSTGRFGSRYGVGIRKSLLKTESRKGEVRKCPNCGSNSVKRKSKGIFFCRKCSHEFVGGAYLPKTLTGGIINQMVAQKKFAPELIGQLAKARGEEELRAPSEEAVGGQDSEKEGEN